MTASDTILKHLAFAIDRIFAKPSSPDPIPLTDEELKEVKGT